MTLEELKAKLPAAMLPWVDKYGPIFIAMSTDELMAWIEKLAVGNSDEAYKAIIAKLPNSDLFSEWEKLNASWQSANEANVAKREVQTQAIAAILRVLLTIALATVGL